MDNNFLTMDEMFDFRNGTDQETMHIKTTQLKVQLRLHKNFFENILQSNPPVTVLQKRLLRRIRHFFKIAENNTNQKSLDNVIQASRRYTEISEEHSIV